MKDVVIIVVGVIAACVLAAALLGLGSGGDGGLLGAIKDLFTTQVNMLGD